MELRSLTTDLHSRILKARSMYRIIQTPEFEDLFLKANGMAQEKLKQILESHHQEQLEIWIKDQRSRQSDLSQLSVRDLRHLAQSLGVDGYIYLPKSSLLSAIKQKEALPNESSR